MSKSFYRAARDKSGRRYRPSRLVLLTRPIAVTGALVLVLLFGK